MFRINSQANSASRVQLVAFDIENETGLFKLQDKYADQQNFIDVKWMLERDEVFAKV